MFMTAASVSRARLLSTRSCSTIAVRNCTRACFCRVSMSTAPLILSRTAVALCSLDGSITSLERVDRGQFAPAVEPQLARLIRARDQRAVGQIQRREGGEDGLVGVRSRGLQRRQLRSRHLPIATDSRVAATAAVAVVQGGGKRVGKEELIAIDRMRPPAWRVWQYGTWPGPSAGSGVWPSVSGATLSSVSVSSSCSSTPR